MRRYDLRSTGGGGSNGANNNNGNPSSRAVPPNHTIIRSYVKHMECERNVAERIGRRAYDGCREFLATGPEGTPAALICAACHCDIRFHRPVIHTEVVNVGPPHNNTPPPAAPRGGATA